MSPKEYALPCFDYHIFNSAFTVHHLELGVQLSEYFDYWTNAFLNKTQDYMI